MDNLKLTQVVIFLFIPLKSNYYCFIHSGRYQYVEVTYGRQSFLRAVKHMEVQLSSYCDTKMLQGLYKYSL